MGAFWQFGGAGWLALVDSAVCSRPRLAYSITKLKFLLAYYVVESWARVNSVAIRGGLEPLPSLEGTDATTLITQILSKEMRQHRNLFVHYMPRENADSVDSASSLLSRILQASDMNMTEIDFIAEVDVTIDHLYQRLQEGR